MEMCPRNTDCRRMFLFLPQLFRRRHSFQTRMPCPGGCWWVVQHLKMGFIVLICKGSISLHLPGPLLPMVNFNMYAKAHDSLLGTRQYHLYKGKEKSVLFKMLSSSFFALGRWQSSRSALVFSLWILGTATAIYQTVIMPTVLDGICICTDAVFENRMVLPTLGSRHGQIRGPRLRPLEIHPCSRFLGKFPVSADLGWWAAQMLRILGGDLPCLWQKNS